MGRDAYRENAIVQANGGLPMLELLKRELAGLNPQQLAAKWGVEPSTIHYWLRKYRLSRKSVIVETDRE